MQSNTITIGEAAYDRFKETPDKTTYVSPVHTVSSADLLLLGRSIASSDTANAKSRASFIRDITRDDPAGTKGRVYFNVEVSFPQWATDAQLQAINDAASSFLSSTEFDALVKKQSI